jgi:hypothetical protein
MHGHKDCTNILIGKTQGKRTPQKPRSKRQSNIKMNLKVTEGESVAWIRLA